MSEVLGLLFLCFEAKVLSICVLGQLTVGCLGISKVECYPWEAMVCCLCGLRHSQRG